MSISCLNYLPCKGIDIETQFQTASGDVTYNQKKIQRYRIKSYFEISDALFLKEKSMLEKKNIHVDNIIKWLKMSNIQFQMSTHDCISTCF